MNNNNTVQLSLFSRGDAVTREFAQAINVVDRVMKDKNKAIIKDKDGKPVIASQTIRLLPRKSEEGDDLATLTGKTGQALMAFEAEARQGLLKSASSHMMGLIASGNYTFDLSRVNLRNGKFMLQIKPAVGRTPVLNPEELKKQAEALGYTLVPKEDDETAPAPTPQNGEVEIKKPTPEPAPAPAKPKSKATPKPRGKAAVIEA